MHRAGLPQGIKERGANQGKTASLKFGEVLWKQGKEGEVSTHMGIISVLYTASGEGNGTPLQYSCLENPMDGGAW